MQLKLITVAYDPDTGGFPEEPLAHLEGEVVSVVEHFFHHAGKPHVLLVVHLQSPVERGPRRQNDGGGPRATLTPDERPLYDALRAWRNSRAQADGVPPYVLLTNRQLADIARRRPQSVTDLREIEGIGEAKAGRFGRDVLKVIAKAIEGAPVAGGGEGQGSAGT